MELSVFLGPKLVAPLLVQGKLTLEDVSLRDVFFLGGIGHDRSEDRHFSAYGRVVYVLRQIVRVFSALREARIAFLHGPVPIRYATLALLPPSFLPPKRITLPLVLPEQVDLRRANIAVEIHADR